MILYIISQIYYSAWHIKSIISDSKDIFIAIQKSQINHILLTILLTQSPQMYLAAQVFSKLINNINNKCFLSIKSAY